MKRRLIRCNDIQYRQGFIEVEPKIHANCINLEVWNIDSNINISLISSLDVLPEDAAITGNTEIELNLAQAVELISKLQFAVAQINSDPK
jgi:hypothetical protein